MKNLIRTLFLLLPLLPAVLWSADYYVDGVSGDNSHSGTAAAPLKTISAALAKTSSGDTVWIASAVYRETLTLPHSGITLRAQPQADVRIKGSDLITAWTLYNGAIWQTSSPWTVNSQQVFVDGVPLQQIGAGCPFSTTNYNGNILLPPVGAGPADMTAGSFYYDSAASELYVRLLDGSDPRTHTVEASVRNDLVPQNESLQDIQLMDLQFYHSNCTSKGWGIGIVNVAGQNWVVNHCTFSDGDFGGLAIQGTGHRIINCTCDRNGDVGLKINGSDAAHSYQPWPSRPPENILVSGCQTNHNNYRHFNSQWNAGGMKNVPSCTKVTISQCRSSFNDGPGIWFDIGANDVLIDRCIATDNGDAGIEYEISDNAVISNNLVLRNGFKPGHDYSGIFVSNSDNVRVINNTVHGNNKGIQLHWMVRPEHPSLANNRVQNNIISLNTNDDFQIYIDSNTAPAPGFGNTTDNNLFYRANGKIRMTYENSNGSPVYYRDLAALTAATGMEQHSRYGDPLYAAPDADNFALTSGSPAIDNGAPAPDLGSLDILGFPRLIGSRPDMGAYEFQSAAVRGLGSKNACAYHNVTNGSGPNYNSYSYDLLGRRMGVGLGETREGVYLSPLYRHDKRTFTTMCVIR